MDYATAAARRSDGWALTSHDFQEGRRLAVDANESHLLELEISERGALRLFCGRGTDTIQGQRVVLEDLVVGLGHRVLAIAKQVAEEGAYWGSWDLGVAMPGMRGAVPWLSKRNFRADTPAFPDDRFSETTRATYEELASRPNAVADRLVGRFVRALGVRGWQGMRDLLD